MVDEWSKASYSLTVLCKQLVNLRLDHVNAFCG